MEDGLKRVALVTGAAHGLGRAIAVRLASDGVAVVVAHHTHPAADTIAEIEDGGGIAVGMPLDVTDRDAVDRAMVQVVDRMGGLDILVNNAGGLLARVPIADMSDDHWDRVIAINLTGAFYCTRAAIPYLRDGGRIINVSSLAARHGGSSGAAAYATAKAGLIGLTRAAAKELGPRGVTVNAVAPGYIDDTPFHATFSTAEARRAMVAQTVVGRAGTPADVAALVAYLASPDAGFVTGTVVDLNGGSYFA